MPAGEVVLEEEPYVHVLAQKQRGIRCDRCLNPSESLKRCAACAFVQYCDRVCQKRDWPIHKRECPCLQKVSPKIPMDSVRLLTRLVIARNIKLPMNSMWSRTFDEFMSHSEKIKKDSTRSSLFAQMAFTLKQYTEGLVDIPSATPLFDLFCKMTINTFTICDGELQGIGTGIYLSASLLDHSCQPNAVVTFNGNSLSVRTLEHIDKPSWSNIRISYIELMAPTDERQNQLRDQYYFDCTCDRCQDTELDQLMTSVQCPVQGCSGPVTTDHNTGQLLACRVCGGDKFSGRFRQEVQEATNLCKGQLDTVEEARKSQESEKASKLAGSCIKNTETVLHPYNIHLVRLLDKGMDAAIDTEDCGTALKYGLKSLDAYRKFYPQNSPNLAVQLVKIGKLQLYLQKLKAAQKSFHEGETIMRITHGKDHPLYKELSTLLHQCEEELRMKLEHS